MGAPVASAGRLEGKIAGVWGTFCFSSEAAATVACRQLGLGDHGYVMPSAAFGAGTGPRWLGQGFRCNGSEAALEQCSGFRPEPNSCTDHSADTAIMCSDSAAGGLAPHTLRQLICQLYS